jgi:hypothetical protein
MSSMTSYAVISKMASQLLGRQKAGSDVMAESRSLSDDASPDNFRETSLACSSRSSRTARSSAGGWASRCDFSRV